MNSLIPRGIRNNNPLNIRLTNTLWTGQCPTEDQTDKSFVQFTSFRYGFRAALKLLHNYVTRYDRKTILEIVYRWAPPQDGNNTNAYIRLVSRLLGKSETDYIGDDIPTLFALAAAMAVVESTRRVWMDAGRRAEAVQGARLLQAELNRPPFTEEQVDDMFELLDRLANGKSNS